MAAVRFTEADLKRALVAWTDAGLALGEMALLADGSIRLRTPEMVRACEPEPPLWEMPPARAAYGSGESRHTSAALRAEVRARDGGTCRYCGDTEGPFHVDHVMPISRGGATTLENLVLACAPCNLSKGAKTPEEWRALN